MALVRDRSPVVTGTTAPDAVAAAGLTKQYGTGAVALAPLDLTIGAGERVSLVGHNGSGKTTLIRLLAGLLEPTAGNAMVAGHPAGSPAARAALSYLGDQPVFYDDLSLQEHLEYVARLHAVTAWERRAALVLEVTGLSSRAGDLPMTFSRGLKQKAAICLAFVRPFHVLVVDEPFVGLDRPGREALLALLHEAHVDGAAVVVATHELATVTSTHRVVALRDGVVTFDEPAGETDLAALVTS
jgi:ABC-2 type transport system ATP-binding protein